jgi:penicillin amidase
MMKKFLYSAYLIIGLVLAAIGLSFMILRHSLPEIDGEIEFKALTAPVTINSDRHGIPAIHAENRFDAIRALGYLTARDRLFQMDLLRRKNAGRLAEIFGQPAADSDVRARTLGFNRLVEAVLKRLSRQHRQYLDAYAEGVNSFIGQSNALPFEFTVLDYRPRPWTPQDSILVALGMFDMLTAGSEQEERMLSVMEKSLPKDVVDFLTPDTDRFTDELLNHAETRRPARPIPIAAMSTALAGAYRSEEKSQLAEAVQLRDSVPGSNAWLVGANKTKDGRAILANDMHLGISVPTIWYRAEINYRNTQAAGVILPGLPIIIAGSNNHIAWGSTNLSGDFLDLVALDINPVNPEEYKLAGHWRRFDRFLEKIDVKDGEALELTIRNTVWGPVSTEPLLDKPVAIHWAALDEKAVNLELIDIEQAETLEQALAIVNRTGGPQLNFLTADDKGQIAWTLMGKIPNRVGGDGAVSRSWANGTVGWNGYVDPDHLPREINPPGGFLVSANNRRFGKDYPLIGRQFADGYRAYRISRQLEHKQKIDEKMMFALQLDAQTDFYRFYQELALSVLTPEILKMEPDLAELRNYLLTWNGKADKDSLGFPLLVEFRKQLAKSVFKPFLAACIKTDQNFSYSWTYIDTPLQAVLTEKVPELLPDPINYRSWDDFIRGQLKRSAERLTTKYPATDLSRLTWGKVNTARFTHPFSQFLPMLGALLDMPEDELSGCSECVRVATPHFGATERLVVSPRHLQDAMLHMPGGQSGQPLSPYYRDQQDYWLKGLPIPLLAGQSEHKLVLKPQIQKQSTRSKKSLITFRIKQ